VGHETVLVDARQRHDRPVVNQLLASSGDGLTLVLEVDQRGPDTGFTPGRGVVGRVDGPLLGHLDDRLLDRVEVFPATDQGPPFAFDGGDHSFPIRENPPGRREQFPPQEGVEDVPIDDTIRDVDAEFAGLDPDDPPSTLAEVRDYSETLVESGVVDVGITWPNHVWFVEHWYSNDGQLMFDAETGAATYHSDGTSPDHRPDAPDQLA
jgi:hypothetical protein